MATSYTDQFFVIDPGNPPKAAVQLNVQTSQFTDSTDDGIIGQGGHDTFEGHTIYAVWEGDTITVDIPGEGLVTVTGVTFYMYGHAPVFTPTDGTVLQDATFVSSTYVTVKTQLDLNDLAPACFTPGTLIDTIVGPVPVEQIGLGDLVQTADDGFQPVRWLGRRTVAAVGRFAPVCIRRGVLGNTRDLWISPQHRILIQGWAAELYAGQSGVLVPALHLVDGVGVRQQSGGHVTYLHLGFGRHVLVRSEGIWSESHFASAAGRHEGRELFPGMALKTVRPIAQKHESLVLAASVLS